MAQNAQALKATRGSAHRGVAPFDFRRPDRISKVQLNAIHMLHDNFVRNLVSGLSAYLRSYLIVELVSVEQKSFEEFLKSLPSPTCMASLSLRPYDGNAVLELDPSLVFPILEMLLGGSGKTPTSLKRELTEIEEQLLDGLFRIILHDLREAWKAVTDIDFRIESLGTETQLLRNLAANEAVVAVGIEIRMGECTGKMNIAMPSIVIKMMRQKFDQNWSTRRNESTEADQARILALLRPAAVKLDVRLEGPTLTARDLMKIERGDVLTFDYPVERPVECRVNGKVKCTGRVVRTGPKKAFLVETLQSAPSPSE